MNRNKALTERIALYASAKVTYPVLFIIFLTTFSISVYQYINFTAEKQSYFVFSGYLSTFCVIIFYFSASYKAEISKLLGWKIHSAILIRIFKFSSNRKIENIIALF